MAQIKLTVSELQSIRKNIADMASGTEDCKSKVASVQNSLDMEVSAKQNINYKLDNIKSKLSQAADTLNSYAAMLDTVVNEFVAADRANTGYISIVSGALGNNNINVTMPDWEAIFNNNNEFIIDPSNIPLMGTNGWATAYILNVFANVANNFIDGSSLENTALDEFIEAFQSNPNVVFADTYADVLFWEEGVAGTIGDLCDMFEGYDIHAPEWLSDITGNEIFDYIGYISDAESLIEAIGTDEFWQTAYDTGSGHIMGAIAESWGGNFAAGWLANCFWTAGENILSFGDYINSGNNLEENLIGAYEYINCVTSSGMEATFDVATGLVNGVTSVFGFDFDAYMEEVTGATGGEGMFNLFDDMRETIWSAYEMHGLVGGTQCVVDGTLDYVSDTFESAANTVGEAIGTAYEAGQSIISSFEECCGEAGEFVGDTISGILGWFKK